MQALTYKRITTTTDERVTQQSTELTSGYSNRPFVAPAEASFFARRGFMQEDAAGRLYSAPDADVLLDEDFAATHCFHIDGADTEHPGQIGLAFAPARGRDARAVAVNGAEQRVDLDDAGHFVVCGVARERPIHLRYMEGERFADTTVITADTLMHPVEWRPMVSPPKRNPLEIPGIEPNDPIGETLNVSRHRKPHVEGPPVRGHPTPQ